MGSFWSLLLVSGCAHPAKTMPPPPSHTPEKAQISSRVNQWSQDWTPLFDGKTLTNWAVTDFGGHGGVSVGAGQINISLGAELSGITWTNGTLPKTDYEISLQAMKVDGSDFFCGLTFPVADSWCSLIIGGWGGGVIGLSSLDDNDASENETTRTMALATGHWYQVRLRVTPAKIEAWLDEEKIINVSIVGRTVSLRPGSIFMSEPLGAATYETSAALRDLKLRLIEH
jgi:hypothetical protein